MPNRIVNATVLSSTLCLVSEIRPLVFDHEKMTATMDHMIARARAVQRNLQNLRTKLTRQKPKTLGAW